MIRTCGSRLVGSSDLEIWIGSDSSVSRDTRVDGLL